MKVIDAELLDQVSGGRGNNGGDRADNGGGNRSRGGNGGGAPKTCANDVGIGIITGAMTGAPAGPWAMAGLAVAGAITTSLGCPDRSPHNNNNSGALGGDHSPNSVNGQCHW